MNPAMLTHTLDLVVEECCKCGMPVGLSRTWVANARAVGEFKHKYWCPYCGITQGWGVGQHQREIEKLTEERDHANRSQQYYRSRLTEERARSEHLKKSRNGLRGAFVKVKKRISAGVCPCCTRHFTNLERHMASQHPGYSGSATE